MNTVVNNKLDRYTVISFGMSLNNPKKCPYLSKVILPLDHSVHTEIYHIEPVNLIFHRCIYTQFPISRLYIHTKSTSYAQPWYNNQTYMMPNVHSKNPKITYASTTRFLAHFGLSRGAGRVPIGFYIIRRSRRGMSRCIGLTAGRQIR